MKRTRKASPLARLLFGPINEERIAQHRTDAANAQHAAPRIR